MIYLLGGNGYVGGHYQDLFNLLGVEYRLLTREGWQRQIAAAPPDFLINCAGYTGRPNVEACEENKAMCLDANAVLPFRIADACEAAGVPWAHVSSGCIYSGTRPDWLPWREEDAPNFCFGSPRSSFYSGTKALGEQVLAGRPNCYIWRLRVPFTHEDHPRNLISKLMAYDRILDSTESLTELNEFCQATLACWQNRVPFGTYNVVNSGAVTKREIIALMAKHGVCRKEFRYWQDEAEFMRESGKTPRSSCVLDSRKLLRAGIPMTNVHEALEIDLENWKASPSP